MSDKAIGATALGGDGDSIAVASPLLFLSPATAPTTTTTASATPTATATTSEPTATATSLSDAMATTSTLSPASHPASALPPAAAAMDADADAAGAAERPTGLHSPPDSNNASKADGGSSDSELSDLDDDVLADALSAHPDDAESVAAAAAAAAAAGIDGATTAAASAAGSAPGTDDDSDDIGDVNPDHYSGTVPVFRPNMHQFRDFKKFMEKIDKYGMKSGIVKIIPPQEWKDSLAPLDELVKTVKMREPIKQEIMGSNGTYRQVNLLHQRSYNLPQWKQLCDQSEHQPPARRGERRANADKPKAAPRTRAATAATAASPAAVAAGSGAATATPKKGKHSRAATTRRRTRQAADDDTASVISEPRPMTPESQRGDEERIIDDDKTCVESPEDTGNSHDDDKDISKAEDTVMISVEEDHPAIKKEVDDDVEMDDSCAEAPAPAPAAPRRMGFTRQASAKTQSTSARRKYLKREGSAKIDEAAFKDWDYRMDVSDYTPERCEELERIYWKTLTYAPPLYGADLPGTLFDESTKLWNLNRLPNLLDVLGTKVPGVNTAYLYLGMWKATFAWHLEDVDLYSINYLHFGAPKQWYSISQGDARRFEAAMKNVWPADAKACDQFLRHKAFLISPSHLLQHYNIRVNKCVSYPGEFVVTYPYGYHSGYNLGYNCAEAVNFALESWLPMGKIAKKCECAQAQDSVWVDVYEIERKLRGISTEDEDEEDEEFDEDMDDVDDLDDQDGPTLGLPSPPSGSRAVRIRAPNSKKRKRKDDSDKSGKADAADVDEGLDGLGRAGTRKLKRMRLRLQSAEGSLCCLCPNDVPFTEVLPTDDGRTAHRMCALYLPETCIDVVDGKDVVANVADITAARLEQRCMYCRLRRGVCFQCSSTKCSRSYHATCAAAAGVFVEEGQVPVFGEDGTEYKEQAFLFTCRFHRTKRDRKCDGEALEKNERIRRAAATLTEGAICQMQLFRSDIFAGIVLENRIDEEMLLLLVIPSGDKVEVDWKWLLLPETGDYHLPKASPNALPLPKSRKEKEELGAKKRPVPVPDDEFVEGYTWREFNTCDAFLCRNKEQARVDLSKPDQVWYYIGQTSTDTKPHYTDDPARPVHNPKSAQLDPAAARLLPAAVKPPPTTAAQSMQPPRRPTVFPGAPAQFAAPVTLASLASTAAPPATAISPAPVSAPPTMPTGPVPPALMSAFSVLPNKPALPLPLVGVASQNATSPTPPAPHAPPSHAPHAPHAPHALQSASLLPAAPPAYVTPSTAQPTPPAPAEPRRSYSVIKPPEVPHTSPRLTSATPVPLPQLPQAPNSTTSISPPPQAQAQAPAAAAPQAAFKPRKSSDSFPTPRRPSVSKQHGLHRQNASPGNQPAFGSFFTMPGSGNGSKFPQIQHPNLSHGYTQIPSAKPPPGTAGSPPAAPRAGTEGSGESTILPPPPRAAVVPTSIAQKYTYFQLHGNKDQSGYRSPYTSAAAGSTPQPHNRDSSRRVRSRSRQGSLGADTLAAAAAKLHKRSTSSTSTASSFGFGLGLKGLTRPSSHTNYVGPPPPPSSTASSPYLSALNIPFGTGPGSSVSSYSYDSVMTGNPHMSPHSPAPLDASPFVGSPGPSINAYDFPSGSGPSQYHHPGMRPQFNNSWQQSYHTPLFSQDMSDMNFSPPSPMTSVASLPGTLGAPANIVPHHHHSFSFSGTTMAGGSPLLGPSAVGLGSMSPPMLPESPFAMSPSLEEAVPADAGTNQSPADQLKQQLRSISDSSLPSTYRLRCLHQPRRRHQSRSSLNRIFTSQLLDLNPT